jgi:uncharacterized protein YggE
MKLPILLALVLPVTLLAQGGLPSVPYLYVEGKAEIEKPADMVTLRLDLVARNADQAKANQEVQTKANKIFALLKERKVGDDDVIAADLKSEPQYAKEEGASWKQGKVIGYSVTRSFGIKVRDVTLFAKLVDELLSIPGTEFSGIDPGLAKEKEVRDEIFEKAVANAREQADKTLKAMDMKIDSLFAISPVSFAQIRNRLFGSDYAEATTERVIVTGSYIPTGGNTTPSEYRLAPVSVSQSIHVIYLISPVK